MSRIISRILIAELAWWERKQWNYLPVVTCGRSHCLREPMASYYFPIRSVDRLGRAPVTISKLDRILSMPLKSISSYQRPGWNDPYRYRWLGYLRTRAITKPKLDVMELKGHWNESACRRGVPITGSMLTRSGTHVEYTCNLWSHPFQCAPFDKGFRLQQFALHMPRRVVNASHCKCIDEAVYTLY